MENIKRHSFKIQLATAIGVVLFVMTTTYTVTSRIKDIESNIRHLNGKTDLYTERYADTIEEQQVLKVEMAKIQTKLSSIEAIVLDIKIDLKNK